MPSDPWSALVSSAAQLKPEPIEGDSMTRFLRSLTNTGAAQGQKLLGAGQELFGSGVDTLKQPLDYFSKLLGGDATTMNEVLAPEVSTIVSQYDSARKAMAEFGPRGGGKNQILAELPQRQAGEISKLFQTVRPQAAEKVTDIGKILSTLGLSESELGSSTLGQVLQALLTRRGQNVQEHGQMMEMATSLAKLLI